MAVYWYKRDKISRKFLYLNEMNKWILKSLLSNKKFKLNEKIYFGSLFAKYTKISSISYYRKYCIMTGNSRSVFRRFKMVRHWCKSYASDGYIVGLRKASF